MLFKKIHWTDHTTQQTSSNLYFTFYTLAQVFYLGLFLMLYLPTGEKTCGNNDVILLSPHYLLAAQLKKYNFKKIWGKVSNTFESQWGISKFKLCTLHYSYTFLVRHRFIGQIFLNEITEISLFVGIN